MSLKQLLVDQDRVNFARRNGDFTNDLPGQNAGQGSRKRKLDDL